MIRINARHLDARRQAQRLRDARGSGTPDVFLGKDVDGRGRSGDLYPLFGRRSNFDISKLLQTQLFELTWLLLVASGSVGSTLLDRSDQQQQGDYYYLPDCIALNRSGLGQHECTGDRSDDPPSRCVSDGSRAQCPGVHGRYLPTGVLSVKMRVFGRDKILGKVFQSYPEIGSCPIHSQFSVTECACARMSPLQELSDSWCAHNWRSCLLRERPEDRTNLSWLWTIIPTTVRCLRGCWKALCIR